MSKYTNVQHEHVPGQRPQFEVTLADGSTDTMDVHNWNLDALINFINEKVEQ
jgi:Sep15/SelM redox domain